MKAKRNDARRRQRTGWGLACACVVGAVGLAACGSAGSGPSVIVTYGTGGSQAGAEASGTLAEWRAAVACARAHGMGYLPDPVAEAGGKVTLPGLRRVPAPTPEVQSACAAQIRAIPSSATTDPNPSAALIRGEVRGAACLRTHGYPSWPDPDRQGVFHVRSADAGTPARLARAESACKSLFPNGWRLTITPTGR